MNQRKLPYGIRQNWRKTATVFVATAMFTGTVLSPFSVPVLHAEEMTIMSEKATVKPPVGLIAESTAENKLRVVYGPSGSAEVDHYEILLDGETLKADAGVAEYIFENVEAGSHTVQVIAVLGDDSKSNPTECETKVTVLGEESADTEETEEETEEETTEEEETEEETTEEETEEDKEEIQKTEGLIPLSEDKNVLVAGEAVTVSFPENEDFAKAITKVLVDGKEASYNTTSSTITVDGDAFDHSGVYAIEVEAENYATAMLHQTIYEEKNWELVFYDEFDGTSLNTNVWSYQEGTGAEYGLNGWGNNEEQYYTSENVSVGDGTLTIEAKNESRDGKSYTSGRIRSLAEDNEGFSITYGKVEAKIKMPTGDGIWPAFWMLPSTDDYGTWASSGEIDIMEARGRLENQVLGTIHYGSTWPDNKSSGTTYTLPDDGTITDYHVYALEWDVDTMIWYVDGIEIYRTSSWYAKNANTSYDYPAPFDKPFHILFNMAVGGTFDGNRRPDDSVFENPVTMDVDYVRVYQRTEEDYYDREVSNPANDKDVTSFEAFTEKYADEAGNFVTDTSYKKVEEKDSIISTELKDSWTRHWYYLLGDYGAVASYNKETTEAGVFAAVDITNGGNQNYAVQLVQHLPLAKGYTYELCFDAYASKGRSVIAKLAGDDDNGWGAYSDNFTASLSTEPKTYRFYFDMLSDTDETARLEFNMGLNTGTVYIGNVSLRQVDEVIIEDEENEKDEMTKPLGNIAPDFKNWEHYVGSDWAYVSSKIIDADEHNLTYTVKADGGWSDTAWGVQFIRDGISVLRGYPYMVSFKITADQNKKFGIKLESETGSEIFYKVYELKAGEEQEISITTEEMTTKTVKVYFATGVFDGEKNIDAVIKIKDFSMVNSKEAEFTEEEKPTEDGNSNTSSSSSDNNNTTDNSSSSGNTTTTVQTTPVTADKLTNVIWEEAVPLAFNLTQAQTPSYYELNFYGTDNMLTKNDLLQLKLRQKLLQAFITPAFGMTLDFSHYTAAQGAINLTTDVDTSIDYGQGFSSVTFIPAQPRKLSDIAVMHLSVGKENAGKVVYLYAQNLATLQMELKQTCIANEIGNVMYETEEYSNIVLLYR